MVPHKYRIIALIVFALVDIVLILLPVFDIISADTTLKVGAVVNGLFTALGLTDAGMVERRRRNPDVPALADDIRHGEEDDA